MSDSVYDVIVVGAGAAGLMCAYKAARRGFRVALIEQNAKVGKKILISGGGRCNFTNMNVTPQNYVTSQNPHFCKSALMSYSSQQFIEWVESHGIAYHEKTLGQLFCDQSARQIVDALLAECDAAGVNLLLNAKTDKIEHESTQFTLLSQDGRSFKGQKVIIATGGLSIPKFGSDGWGYKVAKQFGHRVTPLDPALVGLIAADDHFKWMTDLMGVSLPSKVRVNGIEFEESLLFTHKGISGPVALQASLQWNKKDPLRINFLPNTDLGAYLEEARKTKAKIKLKSLLRELLPKRFVETFCDEFLPWSEIEMANQSSKNLSKTIELLNDFKFLPKDTEGYMKAEVTRGGVDVNEVHQKTFESRLCPGLHFIGEVLDVSGWLGGYNFQWAWASATLCAENLQ